MIGPRMQDAFNRHIQAETYSAYLYLAMSAYCERGAYKGFARWLRVQQAEEIEHAHRCLDFLLLRGGEAKLGPVEAPPSSFGTIAEVFEKVLEHERKVTGLVEALHQAALAEKDTAAQVFLQWFVAEQVEEEARAQEVLDRLRMVGDRPGAALYLDKEYGKRAKGA